MRTEFGILDLSLQHYRVSARAVLNETLQLAQCADANGFSRFWVTEHYNSDSLSCTSPLLLMSAVAAAAQSCKIGAGACCFRTTTLCWPPSRSGYWKPCFRDE